MRIILLYIKYTHMAAVGASGLSLALGVYNTSQLKTLQDAITLLQNDSTYLAEQIFAAQSRTEALPVPAAAAALAVTENVSLSSGGNVEGDIALLDTRSGTNTSNITLLSTELTSVSNLYLNNVIPMRGDVNTLQDNILLLLGEGSVDYGSIQEVTGYFTAGTEFKSLNEIVSDIASLTDDIKEVNEDIASNVTAIDNVDSAIDGLNSRMDTMDETIAGDLENEEINGLSGDITTNASAIGSLQDGLEVTDGNLSDLSGSVDSIISDRSAFEEIAYVGNDMLNVTGMSANNSMINIPKNDATKYGLYFDGLKSTKWAMYASDNNGKDPSGSAPKGFGPITSTAIRTRVENSSNKGFIIENNGNNPVFSVNGQGRVDAKDLFVGNTRIQTATSLATFTHKDASSTCLRHHASGKLEVAGDKIEFRNKSNTEMGYWSNSGEFNIQNNSTTNNTHLNYLGTGDNYIVCADNKTTHFRSGTNGTNIFYVNKTGCYAEGKNIYDTLVSLETKIKSLENDKTNNVRWNNSVFLKNENNNHYVRKASSSDDIIADKNKYQEGNRERFTIEK